MMMMRRKPIGEAGEIQVAMMTTIMNQVQEELLEVEEEEERVVMVTVTLTRRRHHLHPHPGVQEPQLAGSGLQIIL